MNENKEKQYLVIKNVCSNTFLKEYLEKICQDEHVQIVEEYTDSFSFINNKPSIYVKFGAFPSFDILLWSYDKQKLEYIYYLYNNFEKRYLKTGEVIGNIINELDSKNGIENNNANKDEKEKYSNSTSPSFQRYVSDDGITLEYTFNFKDNIDNNWQHVDITQNKKSWFQKFKKRSYELIINNCKKITSFLFGFAISEIFFITILTLKHFMIK